MADLHQAGLPPGQLGARVAALEQQTELAELQRALDDAAARVRQQEQQFRQHRATVRELERQLEETEQRSIGVRQRATAVSRDLERVGTIVDNQERFLSCCSAWRAEAGVGMASTPNSELPAPDTRASPGGGTNQQLWESVRELEQRLAREAERRAAGQGEVLGVLGQGVQQLRAEHARHATEVEDRFRMERRRLKHWSSEAQARHSEHEKRTDALEARVDALTKAITLERRARTDLALAPDDGCPAGAMQGLCAAGAQPWAAAVGPDPQRLPHEEEQQRAQARCAASPARQASDQGAGFRHGHGGPGGRHLEGHPQQQQPPQQQQQQQQPPQQQQQQQQQQPQHPQHPQQHLQQHLQQQQQQQHHHHHLHAPHRHEGQASVRHHGGAEEFTAPLLHRLEQLEARVAEVHRAPDGADGLSQGAGNGGSVSAATAELGHRVAVTSSDTTLQSVPSTPALVGSVRLLPAPPVISAGAVLPPAPPSARGAAAAPGPGTPWPSPVRPSTPSPAGTPGRTLHAPVGDPRWGLAPHMPVGPPVHIV